MIVYPCLITLLDSQWFQEPKSPVHRRIFTSEPWNIWGTREQSYQHILCSRTKIQNTGEKNQSSGQKWQPEPGTAWPGRSGRPSWSGEARYRCLMVKRSGTNHHCTEYTKKLREDRVCVAPVIQYWGKLSDKFLPPNYEYLCVIVISYWYWCLS